jgi:diguanylate cyclase (GGDEF)-like protein
MRRTKRRSKPAPASQASTSTRDHSNQLKPIPATTNLTARPLDLLTGIDFDDPTPELPRNWQQYDSLSGLPNYDSFRKSLSVLLQDWPADRDVALIWIDLLDLRRQFLLYGWNSAEAVVRSVARVLRSAVDQTALLGRFSGRCFVIALPAAEAGGRDRRPIEALLGALRSALRQESKIEPQIAAGVAFFPADTTSIEDLVRFASLAASRAAYLKSSDPVSFQAGMNHLILRDYELEVEMQKGLEGGEFRVVYQPKVGLIDGKILGAETLIRWQHPKWGPVAPSEFIPVAERSGLIHRIFEMTLMHAVQDCRRWCSQGFSIPLVSVNASAENLRREDFVACVRRIARELPGSMASLELEVTESVLFADEDLFALRVRQLKEIDVRIAIDDFGTRYTGFNVLRNVKLDAMKIDKCFIEGINECKDTQVICQMIVAMARRLGMETVAEGIETHAELEALRAMGCETGQGYLFQRPVGMEQFMTFLQEWPERMREFGFTDPRTTFEIGPLQGIA